MPRNLFAACRMEGNLVAKRVRLDANVQGDVERLFDGQEYEFRVGITSEVAFDGSWKPDDDELLTIDVPEEASIFEATIAKNPLAVPELSVSGFAREGVKALFTGRVTGGASKVLIQRFTSQQTLEKKFALFQDGNAFRRLTEPVFTLDSALTAIIEAGKIKFKSQQKLRSIISMLEIYREATDQEVRSFARHAILEIGDVEGLLKEADQKSRKLISSIVSSGALDLHSAKKIKKAAQETGLVVTVQNGKIVMPTERGAIKALLQFLDESRYTGPLSGRVFITNSRRPAS